MSFCHFDMTVQLGPQEASQPVPHSVLLGIQVHTFSKHSLSICLAHLDSKVK